MAVSFHAGAAESTLLEEVTVTAQKREQNVQDVGISITSMTGEQLTALGYANTSDIVSQTPSMRMLAFSPSLTVFSIRGVSQNDFADHYEPPVAVFVDEAYVSSQGAVNSLLFDIDRVEVLRGPQGTLFGRNATGGLVHYVSRKPSSEPDGYVQVTAGQFSQANVEAAVGGPLGERLSARIAAAYVSNDGWLDNRTGTDINRNRDLAYRLQLAYRAGDATDLLLSLHGSNNDDLSGGYSHSTLVADADGLGVVVPVTSNPYGTCGGCDLLGYRNTGDVWHQGHDRIGFLKRDINGATLRITSEFAGLDFTSVTDYLRMNKTFGSDSDASPNDLLTFDTDQTLDQASQELRLSGSADRTRWVAGVYLLYIDAENLAAAGIGTLFTPRFVSQANYTLTTKSAAAFGQLERDLSSSVTLTAGARYTADRKEMDYLLTDNFGGSVPFNEAVYPSLAKKTYKNVSAKLALDWRVREDVLLFAGINRGNKSGSFSAPIFQPFAPESLPHDEEVLTSYEVGAKTTWAEGRLRVNASAFYYDYQDYQAFFLAQLSQAIANRDANVRGVELEIVATPVDGLDLSLGVSHLDGTVQDVRLPAGRVADRDMPMTPSLGLNALARYTVPFLGGRLSLQADATYSSSFNFYVVNPPQAQEPSYTVVNARLGFTSADERWEAALAVRNLGNEEYRMYTNDISSLSIGLDGYAPPRWTSVSLRYRW
jgi:iron complex outermembrane receptor protein